VPISRGIRVKMPGMDQDTVERLELKLAFLERAAAELSDVVYRQHKELEALRASLRALAQKVDARQSAEPVRRPEDERPPHY
jgi:SlyX protein